MFIKKSLHKFMLITTLVVILIVTGCSSEAVNNSETNSSINDSSANNMSEVKTSTPLDENLPDNDMDPDYEYVFDDTNIMEFNIVIDSEDWELMQEDLVTSTTSGKGEQGVKGGQRDVPKERENQGNEIQGDLPQVDAPLGDAPQGNAPQGDAPQGDLPQGDAVQGNNNQITETNESDEPIWVESSITVDGITWDHVGIRYKGNSSLTSSVSSGNNKLSFKLDFDEYEDVYPETDDQRFYGFKQLNLNNNFSDTSLLREKVAADLFDEFGVASSNTTFAVVYVDHGQGSEYYGVYTLIEEMDDTGTDSQFSDGSGNLYKPDGNAASFAAGSYNEAQYEIKTNEEEADYSDVKALYEIINSELRQSDKEAWKSELESVFNVDSFLKWLSVNTVIQNWDTYGNMSHNYYLYNDPETGLLNWVAWDNNEAFSSGKGNRGALSLGLDEVNDNWPLISYLMDDSDYKAIYEGYLEQFVDEVFTVEKMTETYDKYYELIKDYAYAEVEGYTFIRSDAEFDQAIETLKAHVEQRNDDVESYLAQ